MYNLCPQNPGPQNMFIQHRFTIRGSGQVLLHHCATLKQKGGNLIGVTQLEKKHSLLLITISWLYDKIVTNVQGVPGQKATFKGARDAIFGALYFFLKGEKNKK